MFDAWSNDDSKVFPKWKEKWITMKRRLVDNVYHFRWCTRVNMPVYSHNAMLCMHAINEIKSKIRQIIINIIGFESFIKIDRFLCVMIWLFPSRFLSVHSLASFATKYFIKESIESARRSRIRLSVQFYAQKCICWSVTYLLRREGDRELKITTQVKVK